MSTAAFMPVAFFFPPLVASAIALVAFGIGRGWRKRRPGAKTNGLDSGFETFQG